MKLNLNDRLRDETSSLSIQDVLKHLESNKNTFHKIFSHAFSDHNSKHPSQLVFIGLWEKFEKIFNNIGRYDTSIKEIDRDFDDEIVKQLKHLGAFSFDKYREDVDVLHPALVEKLEKKYVKNGKFDSALFFKKEVSARKKDLFSLIIELLRKLSYQYYDLVTAQKIQDEKKKRKDTLVDAFQRFDGIIVNYEKLKKETERELFDSFSTYFYTFVNNDFARLSKALEENSLRANHYLQDAFQYNIKHNLFEFIAPYRKIFNQWDQLSNKKLKLKATIENYEKFYQKIEHDLDKVNLLDEEDLLNRHEDFYQLSKLHDHILMEASGLNNDITQFKKSIVNFKPREFAIPKAIDVENLKTHCPPLHNLYAKHLAFIQHIEKTKQLDKYMDDIDFYKIKIAEYLTKPNDYNKKLIFHTDHFLEEQLAIDALSQKIAASCQKQYSFFNNIWKKAAKLVNKVLSLPKKLVSYLHVFKGNLAINEEKEYKIYNEQVLRQYQHIKSYHFSRHEKWSKLHFDFHCDYVSLQKNGIKRIQQLEKDFYSQKIVDAKQRTERTLSFIKNHADTVKTTSLPNLENLTKKFLEIFSKTTLSKYFKTRLSQDEWVKEHRKIYPDLKNLVFNDLITKIIGNKTLIARWANNEEFKKLIADLKFVIKAGINQETLLKNEYLYRQSYDAINEFLVSVNAAKQSQFFIKCKEVFFPNKIQTIEPKTIDDFSNALAKILIAKSNFDTQSKNKLRAMPAKMIFATCLLDPSKIAKDVSLLLQKPCFSHLEQKDITKDYVFLEDYLPEISVSNETTAKAIVNFK